MSLYFIECGRGDSLVLIKRHSLDCIYFFRSQIRIYLIYWQSLFTLFSNIYNHIISFDFFLVFGEQLLKVPFRLQFLQLGKNIIRRC